MLTNESVLAQPKEPGFIIQNVSNEGESTTKPFSLNEVTISVIDARWKKKIFELFVCQLHMDLFDQYVSVT